MLIQLILNLATESYIFGQITPLGAQIYMYDIVTGFALIYDSKVRNVGKAVSLNQIYLAFFEKST